MSPPIILAALLFALALWLAGRLARAQVGRSRSRAHYFSGVHGLFDRVIARNEPTGFTRVSGFAGAEPFDLQALPDSLTYRKLPSLWVMISLPQPLPLVATLDIMIRPTGMEVFSRYSSLPHSLPCPAYLPDGTGIRSDDAGHAVPESLIARHAGLFADVRVKELLISPKGLRIVIQGDEADRGRYLLFRDAELGQQPLAPARVKAAMDVMLALKSDILAAAKAQAA
jgi:hypothetical protein